MEKREIIKKILEMGVQLDFSALNFLDKNQEKIDYFFEKTINKQLPDVVTIDFIQSVFKEPKIEILKTFEFEKKKIETRKLVSYLNNRYEKLRNLLLKNPSLKNLISINKITPQTKHFSLIGMIKEKDDESKFIIIEDTTGEVTIYFDKNSKKFQEILLDDVLGITCSKNDKIKAKEIIWPEIPLRRTPNKTKDDIHCLFVSDFHMNEKEFNKKSYEEFLRWLNKEKFDKLYLFILGNISSRESDVINFFNNLPSNSFKIFVQGEIDPEVNVGDLTIKKPSILRIEDSVVFLVCHGDKLLKYTNIWKELSPDKTMLNLLKKRQLDPIFNNKIYKEDQILDIVPDVFVSGYLGEPNLLNYKGTTILSIGNFISKPIFWLMNLRTRETIKMDFT